jgi:hypothetical protein
MTTYYAYRFAEINCTATQYVPDNQWVGEVPAYTDIDYFSEQPIDHVGSVKLKFIGKFTGQPRNSIINYYPRY